MTASSTDLQALQQLLLVLRNNGVRSYTDGAVRIELGVQPQRETTVDAAQPVVRMSEDLAAAMARLDPQYSSEALFAFDEPQS